MSQQMLVLDLSTITDSLLVNQTKPSTPLWMSLNRSLINKDHINMSTEISLSKSKSPALEMSLGAKSIN